MKALGYEIDKRQVEQMVEYLDEGSKGVISKEAFLRFMTARLVYLLSSRTIVMNLKTSKMDSSTTIILEKEL